MPVLSEMAHQAVSGAQQGGSLWTNKKTSQIAFQSTRPVRCLTNSPTPHNTHKHLSTRNLACNCLQNSLDWLTSPSLLNHNFLLCCVDADVNTHPCLKTLIILSPPPLHVHTQQILVNWCKPHRWNSLMSEELKSLFLSPPFSSSLYLPDKALCSRWRPHSYDTTDTQWEYSPCISPEQPSTSSHTR